MQKKTRIMKIHVKDTKRGSKIVFFSVRLSPNQFASNSPNEIQMYLTFQSKLTFPLKNPRVIVQKATVFGDDTAVRK